MTTTEIHALAQELLALMNKKRLNRAQLCAGLQRLVEGTRPQLTPFAMSAANVALAKAGKLNEQG